MMIAERQIPAEPPHWRFCYSMLNKLPGLLLVAQQLDTELRDAVCIFYLVLRAVDTIEDDTSIAAQVKVPILQSFHRHISDREWHFSCGTRQDQILMQEFHQVCTAFRELNACYQEAIEDTAMRVGAGMAKFIGKEVKTLDDYDEYCQYAARFVGIGISKILQAYNRKGDLGSHDVFIASDVLLQKVDIILDYLEDINEMPKSRMFWPRQIWGKYVDKLEDLKDEENSAKALLCLNEMVTNALVHAEDCLKNMPTSSDPVVFRYASILKVAGFGTLALCYNNIQVFRGGEILRPGFAAKIFYRIRTMSDVYEAFYDFSLMIKSKVDDGDPNARETKDRLDNIMIICRDFGITVNQRKSYVV